VNPAKISLHSQNQASVVDLNAELDKARLQQSRSGPSSNALRELLFKLPDNHGGKMERELQGVERIRAQGGQGQGGRRPEDMSPQELHAVLWQVLTYCT